MGFKAGKGLASKIFRDAIETYRKSRHSGERRDFLYGVGKGYFWGTPVIMTVRVFWRRRARHHSWKAGRVRLSSCCLWPR